MCRKKFENGKKGNKGKVNEIALNLLPKNRGLNITSSTTNLCSEVPMYFLRFARTQNMDGDLLSIDLTQINSFVHERDLKLWRQEAVAKYARIKYELLRKELDVRDAKINDFKEKIQKAENKLPATEALAVQMARSIDIASEALDHLTKRKVEVQIGNKETKDKYENMIEKYTAAYETDKENLGKNNIAYQELRGVSAILEKIKIDKMIQNQAVIELKTKIKIKRETNTLLLNNIILNFVKALKSKRDLYYINKELAEKRVMAKALLKNYEEKRLRKENPKQAIAQPTQLPKLSLHLKPSSVSNNINIPSIHFPIVNIATANSISNIDGANLLKMLKQRSAERQNSLRNLQTSSQSKFANRLNEKVEHISTINNKGFTEASNEILKPTSKVQILKDEVVNFIPGVIKPIRKRKSWLGESSDALEKKTKRVSFGELYSQEEKEGRPLSLNCETEEVSSFFPNSKNETSSFLIDNDTDSNLVYKQTLEGNISSENLHEALGEFDQSFSSYKNTDANSTFSFSQTKNTKDTCFGGLF